MTVQGAPTQDLELADVIDDVADYSKYSLNCHQLGIIKSYDPSAQTCEVMIGVKRQLANGNIEDYPMLLDVPVIILSGGDSYLSFPISEGDKCLVLFNDRDIDIFLEEDTIALPNTQRAHDYSDGIALIGLRTVSERAPTNEDAVQLEGGSSKIAIKNSAASMLPLMEGFIDVIKSVTVGGGTPLDGSAIAALEAYKVQFQLLLDQGV